MISCVDVVRDAPTIRSRGPRSSACRRFATDPADVRLETDARVVRRTDAPSRRFRYVRVVNWLERQLERLRSFNPLAVDGVLAVVFTVVGVITVFGQDIRDDRARSRRLPGARAPRSS